MNKGIDLSIIASISLLTVAIISLSLLEAIETRKQRMQADRLLDQAKEKFISTAASGVFVSEIQVLRNVVFRHRIPMNHP